jgi:tetratricopeptide (TPR) repeat protein
MNLKHFKELSKVALQAKNYDETILYCNKALEIDPKDIDAWIDKAVATFWLSTGANNLYNESMEYLKKASEISPGDPRILKAKEHVTQLQAWWLNKLGVDKIKSANKIYQIYLDGGLTGTGMNESGGSYIEAMNYFVAASEYSPSDIQILSNIKTCARNAHWISWNAIVNQKIQILHSLNAKQDAEKRLLQLKRELELVQEKLRKRRTEKGFLSGLIKYDEEIKIRDLKAEIAKTEKIASFQPPMRRE